MNERRDVVTDALAIPDPESRSVAVLRLYLSDCNTETHAVIYRNRKGAYSLLVLKVIRERRLWFDREARALASASGFPGLEFLRPAAFRERDNRAMPSVQLTPREGHLP